MKKSSVFKLIMIIAVFCGMLVSFCSCKASDELTYYSQKDNYISVTGKVSEIKYNYNGTELYISFSEMNPVLDDTCFKIVGDNLTTVQTNGIDEKLNIGDQVTFTTAPKSFSDDYVLPIVAISVDGESLLQFEAGYINFLGWLAMGQDKNEEISSDVRL